MKMDFVMSSSLCSKTGVFPHKAAFARSPTVSVAVQNTGGEFFHPIRRFSIIATNSSSSPSERKNSPRLGEFLRHNPMQ